MKERSLYIEHYNKDRFSAGKRINGKFRHYVLGSSRVADLRLLGKNIGGVEAVLEYREPYWYVVSCSTDSNLKMDHEEVSEFKIKGGEAIYIGDHTVRFFLTDPRRQLFAMENEESNQESNTHQVMLICNGDILDSHYLDKTESYDFNYDGETIAISPPKSTNWEVQTYGKYIIRHRLTHKPEDEDRRKPNLELVTSKEFKTAGAGIFTVMALIVGMSLMNPSDPKKDNNKFVAMIYDAKIMQQLKEEAQEVVQKRFVASEKSEETTEKTPEKEYVAKVVKNIRAKGLSNLIGRIAQRAAKDAINVNMLNQMSENSALLNQKTATSAELLGDKLNVSDKKFKVRKVSSVGDLNAKENAKKGASLSKGSVASGDVGIIEEEIIMDGGLDREVIAAYIRSKLGQIRYCYEKQLAANSDLHGKLNVRFTIGSSGKVVTQRVANTTLKNATVEGCILRRVATWKFPTPKGGMEVDVTYPFLFKSVK